jgi:hypothetical protein
VDNDVLTQAVSQQACPDALRRPSL